MKKKVECPKCGGYGFIAKWNDCSAWSEYCFECNGTGKIEVPFTITALIFDQYSFFQKAILSAFLHPEQSQVLSA